MRVGLVAAGVGALAAVLATGALASIHLGARRVVDSLAARDAELRAAPVTREPVVPTQRGTFVDCASRPTGEALVSDGCDEDIDVEPPGVPVSCRALMEAGNRWVEDWLRCAQRESLGPRLSAPPFDWVTPITAGRWLGVHLRALPARQRLDECRLAVADARDLVSALGPGACPSASSLLKPIIKPCHAALADTPPDIQTAFSGDIEDLAGQFPSNEWLGAALEVNALSDLNQMMAGPELGLMERLRWEFDLQRVKKSWDKIIARQKPGAVHFDNAGGPMQFDAMIECDQLRDLLKDLATSPKPAP